MYAGIKALLKGILPARVWDGLRRARGRLLERSGRVWRAVSWPITERTDVWFGRRDPMVPPDRLSHYVGGGDFCQIGKECLRYFVELGGLQPSDRVLDVGCGIGRMAVPLTKYLTTGSYDGFDIVPVGIRWCRQHITPRHPSFRFHLADTHNPAYHRKGRHSAAEYRFPFADACFDFVCLVSVLTHLQPREAANYLREVARVLRPGGRCLMTHFLLNEESTRQIRTGRSLVAFTPTDEGHMIANPRIPEDVVAHPEAAIRALCEDCGLVIQEPVRYGTWCGREGGLTHQDIVVATKAR